MAQDLTLVGQMRSSGPVTTEESKKIVSRLRALIDDFRELGVTRHNAATLQTPQRFSSSFLKLDDGGRVQVYVSVTSTGPEALAHLHRHDLDIEIVDPHFAIVQGWISVDDLEALAAEPVVEKIRPPSYGHPSTGSVDSQGDSIHRCDAARGLGFTGAGAKVGVISGGVDGLAASQASANLPNVQVVVPQNSANDEGTAMLEIVYDCAPGASLLFASARGTSLGFVQAVNTLRSAGAQIIVDDIVFPGEPYFEDGLTAQNDRSIATSALRISAAGNSAQGHYQGVFSPAESDALGTRHNFGGGDTLLRFRWPAGSRAKIFLQWSNRFGSAGDDYDLYVRRIDGSILDLSVLVQNGNDDPLENVDIPCFGAAGTLCSADIQVNLYRGSPQTLEIFCFDPCEFVDFNSRSGSVRGHQAVPEVLAVGAVPAENPSTLEAFSCAGPSTVLFPSMDVRFKPDLVAVNRVATSRPGFNPFPGTSAAAPHVAGIAALVMQAMGPGASPATVRQVLKATAIDLGPAGPDLDFGYGRADALAAIQSLAPVLYASVLPGSRSVRVGTTATAFTTIINAGTAPAVGCGIAPITGVPAIFLYQTTAPATNQPSGAANTPANIAVGGFQTYLVAFTPTAPFSPTEVQLSFSCANAPAATIIAGVSTLLLSASAGPVPDVVALAATLGGDGIVNIPGAGGTGIFAVATVNVGATSTIAVSVDSGSVGSVVLPATILMCQTVPATGVCQNPPSASVTVTIAAGATPTFGIFVSGSGMIVPFDPANNRIFVRFKDGGGATRGATSVAVRTQ